MDMRQRIRGFLSGDLKKDLHGISDTESLLEAGVLDSMAVLQMVGFLESELGLRVADEDLTPDNFESIESIDAFVRRSARADT